MNPKIRARNFLLAAAAALGTAFLVGWPLAIFFSLLSLFLFLKAWLTATSNWKKEIRKIVEGDQ